ncbi:MAG: TetR family transcriptional regulator, partial [Leifsonia flava]
MTNDGEPTEGLRARKRAATRAAIERTAIDLALDVGYDNITVEMICDACMVSQRTFFNYFGSKSDVLWVDFDETIERLAEELGAAAHDDPVMDAVRDAI